MSSSYSLRSSPGSPHYLHAELPPPPGGSAGASLAWCSQCREPMTLSPSDPSPPGPLVSAPGPDPDPGREPVRGWAERDTSASRPGTTAGHTAQAERTLDRAERLLLAKPRADPGSAYFDRSGLLDSSLPLYESFVLLSQPPRVPPRGQGASGPPSPPSLPGPGSRVPQAPLSDLDARLQASQALSHLASGLTTPSTMTQPLCALCAEELCLQLERQIKDLRREAHEYEACLASLSPSTHGAPGELPGPGTQEEMTAAVAAETEAEEGDEEERLLAAREREATRLLDTLAHERRELEASLQQARQQLAEVEEQETQYWRDVNTLEEEVHAFTDSFAGLTTRLDGLHEHLEQLKRANVYNDAFKIWHDGPFGTINGLRMGKLPQEPVEWAEINAAIGQATLLLDILAGKLRFTFASYKLLPLGSMSRVERLDGDKGTLELYGTNDWAGVFFWNRRFDQGMVALLDCLRQLGEHVEARNSRFRIPYAIHRERIGQLSIRLQANTETDWTKALQYFLIDLKWILAYCSSDHATAMAVGAAPGVPSAPPPTR